MMFKSFRNRIQFWFGIFILITIFVIVQSIDYFNRKDAIVELSLLIEQANNLLLEDYKAISDFYIYEQSNPEYFKTGKSRFLFFHKSLCDSIIKKLDNLELLGGARRFNIDNYITGIRSELEIYDSLIVKFHKVVYDNLFYD